MKFEGFFFPPPRSFNYRLNNMSLQLCAHAEKLEFCFFRGKKIFLIHYIEKVEIGCNTLNPLISGQEKSTH